MKAKKIMAIVAFLSATCMSCAKESGTPSPEDPKPDDTEQTTQHSLANPNATAEAKKLYDVLWSLYGEKTVSGVVACVDWNTTEAENVHKWTGRWPAINVFDFINIHASRDVNSKGWLDYSDLTPVKNWAKAGGVVGCMWHWQTLANNGTDYTCTPGTEPGQTSFDADCVAHPESADYKRLVKDIDQVAGYLKQMQKQGIAVLWRPLHEASGNTYEFKGGKAWFWWGAKGAESYKRLWRFMYERLVSYHKLNNLIWIWNSQMGDRDWYPGDDVVDIVGRDSYYALQYPLMKNFKQLSQEYPSKLITLAECGNGDEVKMSEWADIWQEGSRWSWFMPWYDYDFDNGKSDTHQFADSAWWQAAFATGTVVDRDQMRALLAK